MESCVTKIALVTGAVSKLPDPFFFIAIYKVPKVTQNVFRTKELVMRLYAILL